MMIRSFKHRGLKALYFGRGTHHVPPAQVEKLKDILSMLDCSRHPSDMDLPGFRLHPLKGQLRGYFSVSVSGNWRVIFRFEDGDATDVNLVDYH